MKKIIVFVLFLFLALPSFSAMITEEPFISPEAKPIEASITFDWISKTQLQRDENIKQIQGILFNDKTVLKYNKKAFKEQYKDFIKNKNFATDYEEIINGKREDAEKYYCGFFWQKLLVAYGIQYKNDLKHVYYYDAMGGLKWIDIFSPDYPNFPYWSYQYFLNGELAAAYYYVSREDQYVFDANKKFRGRWYKENMYNRKAKVVMTRSNYGQKD